MQYLSSTSVHRVIFRCHLHTMSMFCYARAFSVYEHILYQGDEKHCYNIMGFTYMYQVEFDDLMIL
jgi:hypothetical protein